MQKSAWLSAAIMGTVKGSEGRLAVCAVAQLADAEGLIHARAEALEGARLDLVAADLDEVAAQLNALHLAGWLAPLEWGPGGELRTALTVPEGV